jgi:HEAT repeat protein
MRTLIISAALIALLALPALAADMGKPPVPMPTFQWREWNAELSPDGNIQYLYISHDEAEELRVLMQMAARDEEQRRREHGVEPNPWKVVYCLSKETDMVYVAPDGTRYRETAGMGRSDLDWALKNEQQYYDCAYAYSRGNVKIVETRRELEEPLLGEYGGVCFFWPRDWQDLGQGIDSHDYDSVVGHYYPGPTRPWARGGTGGGGDWCLYLGHTSVQFAPGREVGGPLGDLGKITLHEWLHQIDGQKGWKCGYIGLPGQYAPGNYHHGAHLFWMYDLLPSKMFREMRMQAPLMSPPNKPWDRYLGFIKDWLLLGPFDLPPDMKTTDAGVPDYRSLEPNAVDPATCTPTADVEEAGRKWTRKTLPWDAGAVNFRELFRPPHDDVYAYAHTYVYCPQKRPAFLWMGSAEPTVVYLNGHKVLQIWRGTADDEAKRKVILMPGWNRLLIKKLDQEGGNWTLMVRFTDTAHENMPDLKAVAVLPEGQTAVATADAEPAPPLKTLKRYKWEWPYNDDWFGALPILTEEDLEQVLGVKGVRILGAPERHNGRDLDWQERRWELIDVSHVDKPENILSHVVPAEASKTTLENDVLLNNELDMSREGANGRSYESMALIRYKKPNGGHGDLVLVRADMIEPFIDLAKSAGGPANPGDNILGFICRDSKTFLVFDTDLGEQIPINELDMLAVKDENVTLTAAPSAPRVLRGKPVNVDVCLAAPGVQNIKITTCEFGTDDITELNPRVEEQGVYLASFAVDTERPAGLITYVIEATYDKDGTTHTVTKPVPINLADAVGIQIRVEGPELIQVPKQTVTVTVTNNLDRPVSGLLEPKFPKGMSVKPRSVRFDLAALDQTKSFTFDVTVSNLAADGWLTLAAEASVPGEATCHGELDVNKCFSDVLVFEDFENGIGGDFGYTNAHYQVALDRSSAKFGRQCLHVYDRGGARYGHVYCFGRSFLPKKALPDTQYFYDTNVYPIVDFWFKTDAKNDNLGLHIVLDNGENGYGVLLNGFWVQQWVPHVMIGQADFTADGEWHHIVLNIDELLDQVVGDTSHFVREMFIGDTRTFASGWWYFFDAHHHYIDNFQIRRDPLPKGTVLEHRLTSPTGAPMLSPSNPVPALDSPVVDGIKATVRLTQLGYMPWEEARFDCYLTNRSDKTITVASWARSRLWEMMLTTPEGEPVTGGWVRAFMGPDTQPDGTPRPPHDIGKPHEAGHFTTLKPGESWRENMPVYELLNQWANENKFKLEPGHQYVIRLRYNSDSTGEAFGLTAWTGTVESNTVKLTLIAMPTLDEELAALSTSLDPVRRAKAAAQLGKAQHEPAVPALINALLNDKDGDVRLNAAWALGNLPRLDLNNQEKRQAYAPIIEALVKALDDENWRVGEYAATALGRLGEPSATPALLKRLGDKSNWVRRRTCDALRDMGDPTAAEGIAGLLKDDRSRDVRLAAFRALGQLCGAKNRPVLDMRNRVADLDRRIAELDARLAEIPADDADRAAERERIQTDRTNLVEQRDKAAAELAPLQAEFDGLLNALNVTLDDEFFLIRQQGLGGLAGWRNTTDADLMGLLIAHLNDPHENCRDAAIRGLGEYGQTVPAEAVARITELLSDPYDNVRRAAVEQLPRMTGKTIEELTGHDNAYWIGKWPRPVRDPNEKRGEAAE